MNWSADVSIKPPVAEKRPVSATLHGDTRVDEYAWLREKESTEVRSHLEAENAYTAAMMADTAELQSTLFEEIKARILETDVSLPTVKAGWAYYGRTEEGKQYGIHCRRPATAADTEFDPNVPELTVESATAPVEGEQILLDENELAQGHGYFALGTFAMNHAHDRFAYAIDTDGDEVYELRIRDCATNTDLPDVIAETAPGAAWSRDGSTLYYLTLDDTMRPWQVWRHIVGTDSSTDACIHQEDDERFFVNLGTSLTEDYVFVAIGSQITSEIRVLSTDDPNGALRILAERRQGIEYSVDHHVAVDGSSRWLIVTNDGAEDFRLCVAPGDRGDAESWVPAADEWRTDDELRSGTSWRRPKLDSIETFRTHVVLHERAEGLERLRVVPIDEKGSLRLADAFTIPQPDPVHSVWIDSNPRFDTGVLRFGYTSMTTPSRVEDLDLATMRRVVRKRQQVLGDFSSSDYVCERVWATASDGERIPISVLRRVDTPVDGTAPGMLYGYGSYEISIDPTFSSIRLSLVDRGMIFAIAHIRGGGEMGRSWYLNGKFLQKRNTFSDFIACGEALIAQKYVASDRLSARGGSAGGLLMGAVLNERPDLFAAIVAEVPFVDSLTTMLDETLPLTAIEWEEWGNPQHPEYYAYMKSYAPYENVRAQSFPPILVTAGLNDPRVSYWEPAKWVQRLRENTTSNNPVLLKTEMGAGHGGPSGRYDAWRDEAFVYAFLLRSLRCWP